MKKTALACSNLALIKYWGKVNEDNRLPANDSLSVNLDNLTTTTTVEFSSDFMEDSIEIDGRKADGVKFERLKKHLDRIRELAGIRLYARVVSRNNFPQSTGLSSSASGFAALTYAAVAALNLKLTEKDISILARYGSGSASRSIPEGFVIWHKGHGSQSSYAESVFPKSYWSLADLVVIVSREMKSVPTSIGQQSASTSPFFKERIKRLPAKIKAVIRYLKNKDFPSFGELIEAEALELHAIMLTSTPAYIYMIPETLKLMQQVRNWRKNGLAVYFSLNTGHNLHLLCRDQDKAEIIDLLQKEGIKDIIVNHPGSGAKLINNHLF